MNENEKAIIKESINRIETMIISCHNLNEPEVKRDIKAQLQHIKTATGNMKFDVMEKQIKYCKDRNLPFFASKEGRCYLCHRKLEDTGEYHITGCPHCNRSFCD